MKVYWKALHRRINQLSLRERRLVASTSVIVLITLVVALVCVPLYEKWKNLYEINNGFESEVVKIIEDIEKAKENSKKDMNSPYRARVESLKMIIDKQESDIQNITASLIQPRKMNAVLKTMMSKNKLSLLNFKNFPAEKVTIESNNEGDQPLYKHSFKLQLKGRYFSFLKFVKQLEEQEWQLNWDSLDIKIMKYPESELILKFHTLSTSKMVLGL